MEDDHMEQKLEMEVAPALVAVHPNQKSVVVAVGSDLRVFSLSDGREVEVLDDNGGHKDSVRAIRFSKSGNLFVSAGDDKLVKLWDTTSWRCVHTVLSEKRVTSLAICTNEMFVCFADKFGVVHVVDRRDYKSEDASLVNKKAVPILSHYCSIITRLEFSPDGRYIVTADRDFKIRVTIFPKEPLNGAHEIQSFCLGHTEFVSCLAFVGGPNNAEGLLVSGSGDSTVRLWDYTSGSLLDTCFVGDKVGVEHSNGIQEAMLSAITDLCVSPDGSMVAVAHQRLSGIIFLRCNIPARKLSIAKVICVNGEKFIPTSIAATSSTLLLWMVMGASTFETATPLARVRVLSGFCSNTEHESLILQDQEVPGGDRLLGALQGKLSIGEAAFSATAEAVKKSMQNLLIKKQYSAERRELRKRGRNDKKVR